jgi:3,4-dihydroxy 2-butanone 4-phosphate synthase/GTP cyclohydrolase II
MSQQLNLSNIDEVIKDFADGKMIIIVDDKKRENEGDLVVATEKVTSEIISFMMHHARGMICVSISDELAGRLKLPLQVLNNNSPFNTPFTVSVDHKSVAGKGMTASARIRTLKALMDDDTEPEDMLTPGHVFPLIANPSGVIARQGQTEGSYDLARLAGLKASGVICEILNENGTMARGPDLNNFSALHKIKICSVEQIIKFRVAKEVLVKKVANSLLHTDYGDFSTSVFEDELEGKEHLALVHGDIYAEQKAGRPVLTRIHSECLTGDIFGSRRCDCGSQLAFAMNEIVKCGSGVVLYLRQEGRGIGLLNKLKAYELQDRGHDTVEANIKLGFEPDQREYAVAANILNTLGVKRMKLMTNNPRKIQTLEAFGLIVEGRIPVVGASDPYSKDYLETKRTKLGHLL